MTREELADRFTYHAPTPEGVARHSRLSLEFTDLAVSVDHVCGADSREKSLALTKLEEAKFWASAAVARHEETR